MAIGLKTREADFCAWWTSKYDFFLNCTPLMIGANSGLTWAHVDDIAAGHILALERGKTGEAYILAGSSMTYCDTLEMWSRLTGIPAPKLWAVSWVVGAMQPIVGAFERVGISMPIASESLASLRDYTYFGNADKAKHGLGWQPRAVEDLFKEVLSDRIQKRQAHARSDND